MTRERARPAVDDALATAADLGLLAAVGRCSQDDGAPPLWPWYALLDGLGIDRPAELERAADGSEAGPERAFAVQDALARAVRERPVTSRCSWWWRTCTGPTPAP